MSVLASSSHFHNLSSGFLNHQKHQEKRKFLSSDNKPQQEKCLVDLNGTFYWACSNFHVLYKTNPLLDQKIPVLVQLVCGTKK